MLGVYINFSLFSGIDNQQQSSIAEKGGKTKKIELPAIPLRILIAKTVSLKDLDDIVLKDIDAMTKRDNISVHWRLFCYDLATNDELVKRLENNKFKEKVEVIFEEKRLKNFFWQKHMTPASIPREIDYVWMQDGDMSIREMAWSRFWYLVHVKYKPAIFMPAHHSFDPEYDMDLWHAFTAHYDHCDRSAQQGMPVPHNHYSRLEAVEVENFETCLPGFRRDVWTFIHTRFNEKLPNWGHHETDWGTGQVWCSLVEREFLMHSPNSRPPNQLRSYSANEVKHDCTVADGGWSKSFASTEEALASRPISCLIIHHKSPVRHFNTKSYNKTGETWNEQGLYRQKGKRDEREFMDTFGVNKKLVYGRFYYRVFFS